MEGILHIIFASQPCEEVHKHVKRKTTSSEDEEIAAQMVKLTQQDSKLSHLVSKPCTVLSAHESSTRWG